MSEDEYTTLVPPTPVVVGLVSEEDRAIRTLRVVVWLQASIAVLYGSGYGFLSMLALSALRESSYLLPTMIATFCIMGTALFNGALAVGLHQHALWGYQGTRILPVLLVLIYITALLLEWYIDFHSTYKFVIEARFEVEGVLIGAPFLLYLILMIISIISLRRPVVRALFYPGVTAHRP